MSKCLKNNYYDACMSVSVFEHILMPWKVVLEINKILKMNGVAMIATHQSLGMHDSPWDFYRYSDQAWRGLFNVKTGFEIIDTSMSGLNHVIPFCWNKHNEMSEKAAGYESSVVLVKKISNSLLNWDVNLSEIINTKYPNS
jgi:2-polyprenyl-3-methyl-5-hydroxy-6-metoxy-1,4-benzoquinol methylase